MKKYIYLIILLFISIYSNAQSSEILFEKGNQAYKNKQYEIALKNYFQINNKKDISADLYYNIGNTNFRLNDYANAILYYERGILLKPYDDNLNTNLKIAKARLKSDVYIMPNFFLVDWWNNISNLFISSTWTIVSIILLLISCIVFTYYYFSVNNKKFFFYSFILSSLLFIVSFFAGFTRQKQIQSKDNAIVFSESTTGKDSPDENSTDKIKIVKGQKIKIIDKSNNWIKIKTEDGKEAWIENKNIVII